MDKNSFFRNAALFRRRRRRAYGGYIIDHEYGTDATLLEIQKTSGYNLTQFYSEPEKPDYTQPTNVEQNWMNDMLLNLNNLRTINQSQKGLPSSSSKTRKTARRTSDNGELINPNETIDYVDENGKKYTKRGGSISWRANNPGNLNYPSLERALRAGAIGVKSDGKGHNFAIFKTYKEGRAAMERMLKQKRVSQNQDGTVKSIYGMIKDIYAPKEDDNNPYEYSKFIQERTGIDVFNRSVANLNKKEFKDLVDSIIEYERFREGVIER